MKQLTIALVQAPLVWENPEANRNYFSRQIETADASVDLFLLPEMFTSGFTMQPESVAEAIDGVTIQWMKAIARERNCAIAGSLVVKTKDGFYNRFVFVSGPAMHYYDKRHLFTLAGEDKAYHRGERRVQFEYKGFQICPMVCYDLRFPAFSRNTTDYDLLLYVANWPVQRIGAWNILLQARAIENMSYVAAVNRVGQDYFRNDHNGQSQLLDFMGNPIVEPYENAKVSVGVIYKETLDKARRKFGFLDDRDSVTVN